MAGDQRGLSVEALEGRYQRGVAFFDGVEEEIVGGLLFDYFPDTLDGIEFGRVRWETRQLDTIAIRAEPRFSVRVEIVARPVIEDEEQLSTRQGHQVL